MPHPLKKFIALLTLGATALSALTAQGSEYDQRLVNLSTRGQVGTGANIMITGFVVQDGAPKRMLIRAVGPRLATAPFNVPGTLTDPVLSIYNRDGIQVNANDNWTTADATTMSSVGAFALNNGSRDAAIVATLSPGVYTAQVTGANGGTGIALLEVYDISGSARLMNLSTRALVGSGANILISGLVVGQGGGARKVLLRASGPALAGLGVPGTLPDPILSVVDQQGRTLVSNDNWDTNNPGGELDLAFTQGGAFPFQAGGKDAALIANLTPGNYTVQVSSVTGVTGLSLVEVYDLTPDAISTVGIAATRASTDTTGAAPAVFTLTRVGPSNAAIDVRYTVSGTAVPGTDYAPLSGTVHFNGGETTATIEVAPRANAENVNNRTATVTLTPDPAYGVAANNTASVTIFYNPGTLYSATLRPAGANVASTAYGTATIQLSPTETFAYVNLAFSNLSSPEVVAHLAIDGNYIATIPNGQVSSFAWFFQPTITYSVADIIAALKAGRVYVAIDSASYPTGELKGTFFRTSGSAAFNPPPTQAYSPATPTPTDAARFLTQATFGPTTAGIAEVVQKGYVNWINDQMALPATSHRAETLADWAVYTQPTTNPPASGQNRQAAWWKTAVNGPDQLRQRVAFALSEIFVVSDVNGALAETQEGLANYYDLLVNGAFGNFRKLLEDVTLSPVMGVYLSSLRNGKGTFDSKGNVLTSADENYAREVMQLFTVGLQQLQPDGTLVLDPTGQPIPTYDQATISETAKVFTGWAYNSTATNPSFRGAAADWFNRMMLYPAQHDTSQKTIIGGRVLPAGQGGLQDLTDTLDTLFNHPNTAPFISRLLIQRLVTSNPSPGYVYRVAQVFANNGAGVRGDLGAVIRAILTDYEARSNDMLQITSYGKVKEPIIRLTALMRAFGAASNSGRLSNPYPEDGLLQAALRSPTVFNFFEPNFVQQGPLAAAGLYAPELQIMNDVTALTVPNFLHIYIYNNRSTEPTQQMIGLDLSPYLPIARSNPSLMLDQLNLLLCSGTMPQAMKDRILLCLSQLTSNITELERARIAIYLITTAPEGSVQK